MRFPLFCCLTTFISQEKLSICNFSDFSIFFAKLSNDVKGVCFYSKTEKAPYRKISKSTLKYLKKSLFNSNFKKYQKSKKEMFSILLIFLKKVKKKTRKIRFKKLFLKKCLKIHETIFAEYQQKFPNKLFGKKRSEF